MSWSIHLGCNETSEMNIQNPGKYFYPGIGVANDSIYKFKSKEEIKNKVIRRVISHKNEKIIAYYYFDQDGIFCENLNDATDLISVDFFHRDFNDPSSFHFGGYFPNTQMFLEPPYDDASYLFHKIAIAYMEPGMTIQDFEEQMNFYRFGAYTAKDSIGYPRRDSHFKGLDRDITKVYQPDFRRISGDKKKAFDYIIVDVNIRIGIEDKRTFIHKHWIDIAKYALDKIENSQRFKKYGVPINILKLDKIYRIEENTVELIFELKDELKEVSL